MANHNENRELAIKLTDVKKMYKLGQIGGGTLKADLESWWAKKRGLEDPNTKIGEQRLIGQTFMALNGIDLEVYKGEALGIIGGNGAGKSTMLKLLSRVTAPTSGKIQIWGRIASMLEVGTGFNGEMTGRENIYMNGAILGMTKEEIDTKMEDIIEFSEVRDFIDTPVKRYSSGMYVKLAFSVAAHLDSEIMIMDEVLAVGDINFQQKCLKKMRSIAVEDGRTVLYVSHNMSTIKALCSRCIVLDKGKCVFQGDVDEAIRVYEAKKCVTRKNFYDVSALKRISNLAQEGRIEYIKTEKSLLAMNEPLSFSLGISSKKQMKMGLLRFIVFNSLGTPIAMAYSNQFMLKPGNNEVNFKLSTKGICAGEYLVDLVLCEFEDEIQIRHDAVAQQFTFEIEESYYLYNAKWNSQSWGSFIIEDLHAE